MPPNPSSALPTIFSVALSGDLATASSLLSATPSLVRAKDDDERTALHWACSSGKPDLVTLLLEKGSDVNATDDAGWTPVMIATATGQTDCLELVLRAGANVNLKNENGQAPLHYAASKNRLDIVKLLLNPPAGAKANTNAVDSNRQTALHRASAKGYDKMVELLLAAGAEVDKEDKQGNTPLHLACEEGHGSTAVLLIGKGASLDAQNNEEKKPLDLADRAVKRDCIPAEKLFEEQLGNSKKGSNDRFSRFPPIIDELRAKAKSLGLFNMFLPNHYEGFTSPGLTNLEYGVLCEILGRSTTVAPLACNCNAPDTGNMELLAKYGTDAQKKKWLEPLFRGEIHSAFLMTEPNQASSDATNVSTRIERDGRGNYVINGRKWWITNGNNPRTKLYILLGKTAPDHPEVHRQQSIVLIPRDTPGITIVRNLTVFGEDDAPIGHCEILLENVVIPMENIVLGEGRGFEVMQGRMGPGRIHHAMRAIGQAERALDKLIAEATNPNRRPFGQLKGNFQKVQWDIATSRMEIDQARLLVLLAADMIDKVGTKAALREIAMAKVIVPNVLQRVIDRAVQLHGAGGVSADHELAEMFSNARTLRFVDGPDEVHTQQIGKLELRRGEKVRKAFEGYKDRSKALEQGKKL
ncbi:hypothetical protein HDU93_000017 [Gonapodya sp. JEL0774]|nr:hypothetical protein HDU93_000017 [Gonapodya sp. JEL0774]